MTQRAALLAIALTLLVIVVAGASLLERDNGAGPLTACYLTPSEVVFRSSADPMGHAIVTHVDGTVYESDTPIAPELHTIGNGAAHGAIVAIEVWAHDPAAGPPTAPWRVIGTVTPRGPC